MSTGSRTTRLFLDHPLEDDSIRLTNDHARYLGRVLRLKRGDSVVLFNGQGQERHAVIQGLSRQGGELDITHTIDPMPESSLELTLVHALAKADAMDLIVQKATELGVGEILPVFTKFSVIKLSGERVTQRRQHWQRVARSACEQCGRHFPPRIGLPQPLAEYLPQTPVADLKLVLHRGSDADIQSIEGRQSRVSLLIGPEGGLSEPELRDAAYAGFNQVGLGPRTLRTETAALVGCALVQALWGDLKGLR